MCDMSMFRGTLGTMTDETTMDTTLQPRDLSAAPQETHPVAPEGSIPSLEEVEAEQE